MKREDIVSSLFWMLVSLGFCYGGYDLGLGSLHQPGSGFIFFWVGLIMVGLSLAILIRALRMEARGEGAKYLWSGIQRWKIFFLIIPLFIYSYVLTDLGFLLSTTLLLIVLFKGLGSQPWLLSIGEAILSTFVTYLIFGVWLGVQFPRGFWGIG